MIGYFENGNCFANRLAIFVECDRMILRKGLFDCCMHTHSYAHMRTCMHNICL